MKGLVAILSLRLKHRLLNLMPGKHSVTELNPKTNKSFLCVCVGVCVCIMLCVVQGCNGGMCEMYMECFCIGVFSEVYIYSYILNILFCKGFIATRYKEFFCFSLCLQKKCIFIFYPLYYKEITLATVLN